MNRPLSRARTVLAGVAVLAALGGGLWPVMREPRVRSLPPLVIDDVSQMNATTVAEVVQPTRVEDVVDAVRRTSGPISVGGARHSMGGQIAEPGSLHLDMRRLNQITDYQPKEKLLTVQAGATWRQIQERIDSDDLSISIMQTYANFTVGGSLSVNVHGRYVGRGPIILSVRSFRIVLPDGTLVTASPTVNSDIFYGAIGGYGGLGVIVDATLELTDNVRVKRQDRIVPIENYPSYFAGEVRSAPAAVFHNGDIYPNAYDTVHAVTYVETADPVTVPERLIPPGRSYAVNRFAYWVVSEWPAGKVIRQHLVDPLLFGGQPVTWRNYEASYDASDLEPASRENSTYVLQEYFVPEDGFEAFVGRMRGVLRQHRVNVINVSIRHARRDPGSLLAWAKTDVFAFVLYYKQGTSTVDRQQVGVWTRELIDAALAQGGSYYLPYQLHATEAQFLKAYPRAAEFFALKRRLDPSNRFRNALWDKYYQASPVAAR